MSSTCVVTGANRGIGYELVKQLLADGHTVVATARGPSTALSLLAEATPDGLAILNCDLASAESIKVFGIELAKRVSRIDVLINNAGICISPENENLSNLQPSIIIEQININVIGTLLVSQAIAPLFHCGTKLVNTSSMVASFATTIGLPISTVPSYSISKAALNMLTVKQALFYADCIVVALDPGLVKTDMNPEGQKSAEDVATSIITVIDSLAKADSGCFVSWQGKKVAW